MSALYAVHFEAMLEKKEKEIADRYPNVVLSPERDAELKKVEHTRSIFQKHGPLQGVDFGKYHRATAERLVEEHLQSFKPLNQEQQLTA